MGRSTKMGWATISCSVDALLLPGSNGPSSFAGVITVPNQSSVAKAYDESNNAGRMTPSAIVTGWWT